MNQPKDPSAMGLLNALLGYLPDRVLPIGGVGPELELAHRHSRNVDKQRRRLLAEKCRSDAVKLEMQAISTERWVADRGDLSATRGDEYLWRCKKHRRRATKLRTWAERLRREK